MKIIDKNISQSVITIGCQHISPKGGVAQVLNIYDKFIFSDFNKLSDTSDGGMAIKLLQFLITCISLIIKLLFNKKIKIVHIHTSSYNSFKRSSYFVRIAKLMRRKIVLHVHGGAFKDFYTKSNKRVLNILNMCDTIIALSEYWKSFFISVVDGPEVRVVKNPIEPPIFKDIPSDGKIHILYLGLMSKDKGIYDLLDILKDNKSEYDGKIVVHLGGNGEITNVLSRINNDGLHDIVKYEGWVTGDVKVDLMNQSNIFILPSYAEGLPLAILEAISYGLYIISTNVGGIPEVVKSDIGILFHPGDKDALKSAIDRCICYPLDFHKKLYIQKKSIDYMPCTIANSLKEIYSKYL